MDENFIFTKTVYWIMVSNVWKLARKFLSPKSLAIKVRRRALCAQSGDSSVQNIHSLRVHTDWERLAGTAELRFCSRQRRPLVNWVYSLPRNRSVFQKFSTETVDNFVDYPFCCRADQPPKRFRANCLRQGQIKWRDIKMLSLTSIFAELGQSTDPLFWSVGNFLSPLSIGSARLATYPQATADRPDLGQRPRPKYRLPVCSFTITTHAQHCYSSSIDDLPAKFRDRWARARSLRDKASLTQLGPDYLRWRRVRELWPVMWPCLPVCFACAAEMSSGSARRSLPSVCFLTRDDANEFYSPGARYRRERWVVWASVLARPVSHPILRRRQTEKTRTSDTQALTDLWDREILSPHLVCAFRCSPTPSARADRYCCCATIPGDGWADKSWSVVLISAPRRTGTISARRYRSDTALLFFACRSTSGSKTAGYFPN